MVVQWSTRSMVIDESQQRSKPNVLQNKGLEVYLSICTLLVLSFSSPCDISFLMLTSIKLKALMISFSPPCDIPFSHTDLKLIVERAKGVEAPVP
jgi:hypothetical protein